MPSSNGSIPIARRLCPCRLTLLLATRATVILVFNFAAFLPRSVDAAETIALWLFDEPRGTYPSSVLDSSSDNDYPLILGQGGRLVRGKFNNALSTTERQVLDYPDGPKEYGLEIPSRSGDSQQLVSSWADSRFTAVMTAYEGPLRNEVGMVNPANTKLNVGDFDWTTEFWFQLSRQANDPGTVFELGSRCKSGEVEKTSLVLSADRSHFVLRNDPKTCQLLIETSALVQQSEPWHHFAFVYSAEEKQLRHYVDGQLQPLPNKSSLTSLPANSLTYFTVGRDGNWEQPLPGYIDELRFSAGKVYLSTFTPPASFAPARPQVQPVVGPPLLFAGSKLRNEPVKLGTRKHLFIDDALLDEVGDAHFIVNPPRRAERVIDKIAGTFRKHLTVVEDEAGVIRIYNGVAKDHLAVRVSRDGIHFAAPASGHDSTASAEADDSLYTAVIPEMVGGLGNPFIDPNGPQDQRWKYFTDYHRRGIYLYTSADGYEWVRHKTAVLPFRSGTQSCTYYDDQRQLYVSFHRSGIHQTPGGDTERSSVMTEHTDLYQPIEFVPLSQAQYLRRQDNEHLRDPLPWYLDNGPLTPGGFGLEFPQAFRPLAEDPIGTDIYVTKAQKYPWAPDTYVAFPIVYFHYGPDGPPTRAVLGEQSRDRGSGTVETQLAVSRDGKHWHRYPRPTYVGIGRHGDRNVVNAYIAHGMVRRGDEIWQYYFGETQYHSGYRIDREGRGVYRLVQRLDGFVSLDSPYEQETTVKTKLLTFAGNCLTLNIDTDATGYAQVGLLDNKGKPIDGFAVDECMYVNGDFIAAEVEWLTRGKDLSDLIGKEVQVVIRMRGCKLYAMQFVTR